jgi:hypothetical protein
MEAASDTLIFSIEVDIVDGCWPSYWSWKGLNWCSSPSVSVITQLIPCSFNLRSVSFSRSLWDGHLHHFPSSSHNLPSSSTIPW